METRSNEICKELKGMLQDEIQWQKEKEARRKKFAAKRKEERHKRVIRNRVAVIVAFFVLVAGFLGASIYDLALYFNTKETYAFQPIAVETIDHEQPSVQISIPADSIERIILISNKDSLEFKEELVNPYIISFTEDELVLFEQIMAAESFNFWTESDILSLATVVINRVQSDKYPDNLWDVLTQDKQFATYADGRYKKAAVTDECRAAVDAALKGERNLNSDVFWFCTKEYYDNASENDFFYTLQHVYTCRNVYFFER